MTAGLVQTALYVDFFYVYFTKSVPWFPLLAQLDSSPASSLDSRLLAEYYKDRSLSCRRNVVESELLWT